jgi:hypothetical protein
VAYATTDRGVEMALVDRQRRMTFGRGTWWLAMVVGWIGSVGAEDACPLTFADNLNVLQEAALAACESRAADLSSLCPADAFGNAGDKDVSANTLPLLHPVPLPATVGPHAAVPTWYTRSPGTSTVEIMEALHGHACGLVESLHFAQGNVFACCRLVSKCNCFCMSATVWARAHV